MLQIRLRYLQGRNANGAHRDAVTKIHALSGSDRTALCGAMPGRLSGGWAETWQEDPQISCRRCIRKFDKITAQTPVRKCDGCSTFVFSGKWCDACLEESVRSIASATMSTYRFLNPPPAPVLSKTPPDNPFLRQLWEAANELGQEK